LNSNTTSRGNVAFISVDEIIMFVNEKVSRKKNIFKKIFIRNHQHSLYHNLINTKQEIRRELRKSLNKIPLYSIKSLIAYAKKYLSKDLIIFCLEGAVYPYDQIQTVSHVQVNLILFYSIQKNVIQPGAAT